MAFPTSLSASGRPYRWAPPLPRELVEGARLYATREDLVGRAKRGAVCAEIGVSSGFFSGYLLRATGPRELHLVDIDLSNLLPAEAGLEQALADGVVILHEGDSATVLDTFPEATFDWLYIDADHSLEGVQRDIAAALPRLKADGVLYFNDYTKVSPLEEIEYGVMEAVHALCLEHGFRLTGLALHGMGYFDVAVTRRRRRLDWRRPRVGDTAGAERRTRALEGTVNTLRFELAAARRRLEELERPDLEPPGS